MTSQFQPRCIKEKMSHISIFDRIRNKLARDAADRKDSWIIRDLLAKSHSLNNGNHASPVLFFNASTRLEGMSQNAGFSIVTALALQAQGVPVVHFVCNAGMSRCVLGTNGKDPAVNPPCARCVSQSRRLSEDFEHFFFSYFPHLELSRQLDHKNVDELGSFEYEGLPLGKIVLPSLRWVLRRHHLIDDETTRYLFREFILSAWNVAGQFYKALEQFHPGTVIVFNGQFFPEAVVKHVSESKGIRVLSHEVALQPFSCFFTDGEATAYPIQIPADFELTETQNKKLDEYLEQRFQGNFSMAGIRFWPEMQKLGDKFWERAGKFKQIVPIFTNVVFDTSQGHANVIFPEMFAWLDATLDLIKRHPETLFVIRAHPDEGRKGKESQESVAQWVRQNEVDKLENVLFVDSGEPFSSYELIQKSKFVMVYNSTIGLESAIMGKAVLCGGKARFTQVKTGYLPKDPIEYLKTAEKLLNAEKISVPDEFQKNARQFLYYQLYKTSIPFGDFLKPDDQWKGYVHLREINPEDFKGEQSNSIKTILNGILEKKPFLLEE